jgi:hypothetical protein
MALVALTVPGFLEYGATAGPAEYRCSFDSGKSWIEAVVLPLPKGFFIDWKDGFGGPYPDFEWAGTSEDIHNVTDSFGRSYRFEITANGFRLLRLPDAKRGGASISCHSI